MKATVFVCTSCTVCHCRQQVWILTSTDPTRRLNTYGNPIYIAHCQPNVSQTLPAMLSFFFKLPAVALCVDSLTFICFPDAPSVTSHQRQTSHDFFLNYFCSHILCPCILEMLSSDSCFPRNLHLFLDSSFICVTWLFCNYSSTCRTTATLDTHTLPTF